MSIFAGLASIDIDFIPYRLYNFNEEIYFELYTKPFDNHYNPKDIKGVIFDSNRSYDENGANYMIKKKRISSFDDRETAVYSLSKNDYVFLSHKSVGIIAIGKVKSEVKREKNPESQSELYVDVEFLKDNPDPNSQLISYSKITELTGLTFYHARIDKRPYLSKEESEILLKELSINY